MKAQMELPWNPMIENQQAKPARAASSRSRPTRSVRWGVASRAGADPRGVSSKSGSADRSGEACAIFGLQTDRADKRANGKNIEDGPGRGEGAARAPETFGEALVQAARVWRAGGRIAAGCADWHDDRCLVCGAEADGFEVSPVFPCPAGRGR